MSTVGDRLKKLRLEKGWSLRELENRTGINYSVLSRIESGYKGLDDEKLKIFADIYNVSTDFIMGRTTKKNYDDFDPIAEHNRLLKKYGIEDSGFFDIEKWKQMGPEELKQLENYFKFIVEQAKNRDKERDSE